MSKTKQIKKIETEYACAYFANKRNLAWENLKRLKPNKKNRRFMKILSQFIEAWQNETSIRDEMET